MDDGYTTRKHQNKTRGKTTAFREIVVASEKLGKGLVMVPTKPFAQVVQFLFGKFEKRIIVVPTNAFAPITEADALATHSVNVVQNSDPDGSQKNEGGPYATVRQKFPNTSFFSDTIPDRPQNFVRHCRNFGNLVGPVRKKLVCWRKNPKSSPHGPTGAGTVFRRRSQKSQTTQFSSCASCLCKRTTLATTVSSLLIAVVSRGSWIPGLILIWLVRCCLFPN